MQVIWALALQHPLAAVAHEVTLVYVGQIQGSSLSCFAVGHTSSSMVPVLVPFCSPNLIYICFPTVSCSTVFFVGICIMQLTAHSVSAQNGKQAAKKRVCIVLSSRGPKESYWPLSLKGILIAFL